ncbi:MAG: dihydroorotate dehydrogenase [Anaerolineae bacterium]|nr:dihydroorotate dehydrogenase [Anaerolineae bacterium]
MIDLTTTFCGISFPNPLVLASGILGTEAALMARVARCGAGGITSKSCGPATRRGHPNPTVLDWGPGLINAVGLANPGVDEEIAILVDTKRELEKLGVPLIASIFADTIEGFAQVAGKVSAARPDLSNRPDLIEVNISCPNVAAEFGRSFALDAAAAAAVTRAVKAATDIPISIKLSPNTSELIPIARAVVEAGADALTAINTLGPGMVIDLESGRPVLANRVGGVSGPATRPIAVRCVYDLAQTVNVPVIGTGGVSSGRDALEMIMAGAALIGVGSAVYWRGPEVFAEIQREMVEWMAAHGVARLDEIRGRAHAS